MLKLVVKCLFSWHQFRLTTFVIGIFLASAFMQISVAQETTKALTKFEPKFANYLLEIRTNADKVLNELLAHPPEKQAENLYKAQYFAVLGQAYYSLTYPQKSLLNAQLALTFTSLETQPWLTHTLRIFESASYEMTGQFTQGLVGVNQAVEWAELEEELPTLLLGLYTRGIISISLTNYVAALTDFQRAYSLANNQNTAVSRADIAGMQAQVYEYRGEPSLAIPLYQEAEVFHRTNENWGELSIILYGLGKANRDIGKIDLGQAQLEESLILAQKINDQQGVAYALKDLAVINIGKSNFDLAKQQLLQALKILTAADNHHLHFNILMNLSELSTQQDQLKLAQQHLLNAQEYLNKETMPLQAIHLEEQRAAILAKQGDQKQAYTLLRKAYTDYKKYTNTESSEQLHRLRVKSELDLTHNRNIALSHQNQLQELELRAQKNEKLNLFIIIFLALCACALLAVIVYRSRAHNKMLKQWASTDELTGLANRRQILEQFQNQLNLSERYASTLCVAMIDLDWFKLINDKHGHFIGDKVLQLFAKLCTEHLRQTDVVGRIGGEEFLVLLPCTNSQDAYQVMEILRQKAAKLTQELNLPSLTISISIGISECKSGDTVEDVFQLADIALYRAKENGRNQVVLCDRRDQSLIE
ncbi:diguanylate cyclase [Paraglaciecola aquimarina]|uniref:diguanylate cyclase n=1 Tax=Paraglaciecola algarum TaxID=3050085 RepID=A0ABS9D9R4_9ALTE|nr:diguanylate cyclase [Paraglaciecola sp. G1-23]MCF2948758.1 diguanylate cyclase [Paraglaciecola sp. G1-23]